MVVEYSFMFKYQILLMNPNNFKKIGRGVFVMMITPFKKNRDLDLDGVRKNTRFLIDKGIKTGKGVLVPTGSTGECPMMTVEEIKLTMKVVVEEAKGEVPVMPTCNSTEQNMLKKLVLLVLWLVLIIIGSLLRGFY